MSALALIEPTRLEALANAANHQHGLSSRSVMSMLTHGIEAGEALNEAKRMIPHGEWLAWLDANVVAAVIGPTVSAVACLAAAVCFLWVYVKESAKR